MGIYKSPLLIRDATFIKNPYDFMMYSNYHEYWYDVDDFLEYYKYDFNLIFNV